MKKLFFCVIVLLLIPVCCYAEVRGKAGEKARWSISEDGVLSIYGTPPLYDYDYDGDDDLYDKRPWLKYSAQIFSITVKNGFTEIPPFCFYGLGKATSISLPDSIIQDIGYSAFEGCSSLTSIVIPDGVAEIFTNTFYECSLLHFVFISVCRRQSLSGEERELRLRGVPAASFRNQSLRHYFFILTSSS